ncbi:MAG: hypothetical protein KAS32_01255 [Candidatus Peribacteraceae bacterium]|nr:hypothetical protein [Candidatus Peribacteraceae bacterium]
MAKKKMIKRIKGTVVAIEVLDGKLGIVDYDFASLPADIQEKLGPFGLNHKLGDSAAGKTGIEAEESIQKVFEGLRNNDWSVRAPAAPKVSTKTIATNLSSLSEKEQNAAIEVLQRLGINIPGITPEAVEEAPPISTGKNKGK